MSGKVITVVNRKGGVGKTTLAIALTEAIISSLDKDERTAAAIAVDLDPQASLTTAMMNVPDPKERLEKLMEMSSAGKTINNIIAAKLAGNKWPQLDDVRFAGCGLTNLTYSLIGNDSEGWQTERDLLVAGHTVDEIRSCVREFIDLLKDRYRYVIVDCPPGQTAFAEGALLASDMILCPLTPDWLAFWGMESFEEHLRAVLEGEAKKPKVFWLMTRFDPRAGKNTHQTQIINTLESRENPVIDFLREAGETDPMDRRISIPFDSKVADRLEGPPRPNKPWTFEKAYREKFRKAINRLSRAVQEELDDG